MKFKSFFRKSIVLCLISGACFVAFLDSCHPQNEKDKVEYSVNSSCTGCGKCKKVCKEQAISIVDGKAVIDKSKCKRCGDCVNVCKKSAIVRKG